MSVRNLDSLFAPRSVAVIGVSQRQGSLGAIVLRNLLQGGFRGPVWPVNRRAAEVHGLQVFPDLDALPGVPDLAVLCTPAATVPELVEALGRKGTRGVIVLSAGLKQTGPQGRTLEQDMLDAARPHLLRVLGPNCIGALVPGIGLNASFAPGTRAPMQLGPSTRSRWGRAASSMSCS
ncbi:MAG: GNAT family N-acetyltransferase, partial [Comamonadaceae bacterium]